jgi:DNA-binding SARP family transcriptional activator
VGGTSLRLLGRPAVVADGIEVPPPKGAKVWALLAYLALSPRPRQRAELAELLFAEAADPLGALRWNLAAMRRLLDRADAFKGDVLCFDADAVKVDAIALDRENSLPPQGDAGHQELLAGLSFPESPTFELWLTTERHRLRRRCCSLLREAGLDAFARGDLIVLIELATDLVATEPHDEGHHALLIRALALDGRRTAALAQFDRSRAFIRAALGCEPGAAVVAAAHLPSHPRAKATRPDEDEIWGHLNVAWQSFLAGSIDHALDLGRNSVLLADLSSEVVPRIASRLYLAAMLNMSVRGWDEAVITTAAATHLASEAGLASFEAIARGVVAGSELMRGDYRIAVDQATTGLELADDPDSRALNFAFLAASESDTGHHEAARRHAAQAVECAELSSDPVRHAYAYAYAAYTDLRAHHDTSARGFARRAIDACGSILVLKPWPMALLAELELRNGDLSAAVNRALEADGLAATTGMPYQRALAQRVLALAAARTGDHDAALERLETALVFARRTGEQGYPFHWPIGWMLESLADLSERRRPADASRWALALREHYAAIQVPRSSAPVIHLLDEAEIAPAMSKTARRSSRAGCSTGRPRSGGE